MGQKRDDSIPGYKKVWKRWTKIWSDPGHSKRHDTLPVQVSYLVAGMIRFLQGDWFLNVGIEIQNQNVRNLILVGSTPDRSSHRFGSSWEKSHHKVCGIDTRGLSTKDKIACLGQEVVTLMCIRFSDLGRNLDIHFWGKLRNTENPGGEVILTSYIACII